MKIKISGAACAVLLVAAANARFAGAETTICTVISSLPYTISAQGNYCLDRNLSTPITSGNAITINTDFVVLDLNGFKVGGGSAGPGTTANGVYALNRKNIVVKNGNIRGFYRAVFLDDGNSPGLYVSAGGLIEDIRADDITYTAISVKGTGHVVRHNQIVNTTGSTVAGVTDVYGIRASGNGIRVLENDVNNTTGVNGGSGLALSVDTAAGTVIADNRLGNAAVQTGSRAIDLVDGENIIVARNLMTNTDFGVYFGSATGKYRDNLTTGVAAPYPGGTDAGNNQ